MANRKRFTVNEVLNILEEDGVFDSADVFITPPDNALESDGDSGDEESGGLIDNLSGNQLRAEAESTLLTSGHGRTFLQAPGDGSNSSSSDDEEEKMETEADNRSGPNSKRRISVERSWHQQDLPSSIADHFKWRSNHSRTFLQPDKLWTPTELFELFFDSDVVGKIISFSEEYARQQGNHSFKLPEDDFKSFLAILFTSGNIPAPRRRLYWENSDDMKNAAISNCMSRNRFEEILRYLHLSDNNNLDKNDRYAKVRPLLVMLNERFLNYFPAEQNLNVDESMVPYYGRHSLKQFIRGKPIRFGYKIWCLNTPLGYLIQFEPYQGAKYNTKKSELGLGGAVVLDLISELSEGNFKIFGDNFFTSLRLIDEMTKRKIGYTGTVRKNRIEKCPVKDDKGFKQEPRGTSDYQFDSTGSIIVCRWKDNSLVTVASNCVGVHPTGKASRWSSSEARKIEVPMPRMVMEYNAAMGATDRMDQNVAQYRVSIRIKKWWWPLFAFLPDVAMQNAWLLYRRTASYRERPLDLLQFRREVCRVYFMRIQRNLSRTAGRVQALDRRIPNEIRYDGMHHLIVQSETQLRCAHCRGKSLFKCIKCNIGLMPRCFAAFHTK